ncbi:MAG: antitoxin Xre/MbcA/ParS toxin-binding domain-containing protein [Cyanobacteriota bacterium]|nr:antitoxin Xre/MbcA/ParS toxin-binding domain-containing protein [Cyanobacteriota bacterium]
MLPEDTIYPPPAMATPSLPNIYQILGFEDIPDRIKSYPEEWQIVNLIRQGFSIVSIAKVAEYCDISEAEIARLLATSERTISRRKKDNRTLELSESDRLYRLARIFARTLEIFEDIRKAREWLKQSNRALAGATPLELLDTDMGAQKVDNLLNRIEYGFYS